MIVGNIINCNEEINGDTFRCMTYDEFELSDPSTLPTLLIGWEVVKKKFGDVSILSKQIYPGTNDGFGALYWTFSPKEKRGIYLEDLKKFQHKCYEDLVKNLKTYNIDPIVHKINTTDELISKLTNLRGGFGYLYQERVIYVYKDNSIYVIDMELIDFIGFDRDSVINYLMENLDVYGDDFEEEFTEELKHLSIKYIPYLKYRNAI